jgi:hypothetical protein
VHHYHRAYGKSQFFNVPRVFRTGVDVWKLWVDLVIRRAHRASPPATAGSGVTKGAGAEERPRTL